MLTTVLTAIGNPGIYDVGASRWQTTWPALIPAVVCFIAFLAAAFLCDYKSPRPRAWMRVVVTVGVIGFAAAITLAIVGAVTANNMRSEYSAEVADWLQSDYQIDVTPDVARDLVGTDESARQTVVVEYDGKRQAVLILDSDNGDLAVADPQNTLLDTIG